MSSKGIITNGYHNCSINSAKACGQESGGQGEEDRATQMTIMIPYVKGVSEETSIEKSF